MANPNPSPATRFRPGNTASVGNGRPKGSSLTEKIRALLAQDAGMGDGRTVADRIAERFVIEALKGKHPFAHDVLERYDGKVIQQVQVEEVRKAYDVENSPDDL